MKSFLKRMLCLVIIVVFCSQQLAFAKKSGRQTQPSGLFDEPSWGDLAVSAGTMLASAAIGGWSAGGWKSMASSFATGSINALVSNAALTVGVNVLHMKPATAQIFGGAVSGAGLGFQTGGGWGRVGSGIAQGTLRESLNVATYSALKNTRLFRENRLLGQQISSFAGNALGYGAYNAMGRTLGFRDKNFSVFGFNDKTAFNSFAKQGASLAVGVAASSGWLGKGLKKHQEYSRILGDSFANTGQLAQGKFGTFARDGLLSGASDIAINSLGGKFGKDGKNKLGLSQTGMAGVNTLLTASLSSAAKAWLIPDHWFNNPEDIKKGFGQNFKFEMAKLSTDLWTFGGTAPRYVASQAGLTPDAQTWLSFQYLSKIGDLSGVSNFYSNADYAMNQGGYGSWKKYLKAKDDDFSGLLPGVSYAFNNYVTQGMRSYAASTFSQNIVAPLATGWHHERPVPAVRLPPQPDLLNGKGNLFITEGAKPSGNTQRLPPGAGNLWITESIKSPEENTQLPPGAGSLFIAEGDKPSENIQQLSPSAGNLWMTESIKSPEENTQLPPGAGNLFVTEGVKHSESTNQLPQGAGNLWVIEGVSSRPAAKAPQVTPNSALAFDLAPGVASSADKGNFLTRWWNRPMFTSGTISGALVYNRDSNKAGLMEGIYNNVTFRPGSLIRGGSRPADIKVPAYAKGYSNVYKFFRGIGTEGSAYKAVQGIKSVVTGMGQGTQQAEFKLFPGQREELKKALQEDALPVDYREEERRGLNPSVISFSEELKTRINEAETIVSPKEKIAQAKIGQGFRSRSSATAQSVIPEPDYLNGRGNLFVTEGQSGTRESLGGGRGNLWLTEAQSTPEIKDQLTGKGNLFITENTSSVTKSKPTAAKPPERETFAVLATPAELARLPAGTLSPAVEQEILRERLQGLQEQEKLLTNTKNKSVQDYGSELIVKNFEQQIDIENRLKDLQTQQKVTTPGSLQPQTVPVQPVDMGASKLDPGRASQPYASASPSAPTNRPAITFQNDNPYPIDNLTVPAMPKPQAKAADRINTESGLKAPATNERQITDIPFPIESLKTQSDPIKQGAANKSEKQRLMAELNVLQELTKALIAEQARQEQIKPLPKQSPYKETKRGTNTLLD